MRDQVCGRLVLPARLRSHLLVQVFRAGMWHQPGPFRFVRFAGTSLKPVFGGLENAAIEYVLYKHCGWCRYIPGNHQFASRRDECDRKM